jgi:hypothetical protein
VEGAGDVFAELKLGFHEVGGWIRVGGPFAFAIFAGVFDDPEFGDLDVAGLGGLWLLVLLAGD